MSNFPVLTEIPGLNVRTLVSILLLPLVPRVVLLVVSTLQRLRFVAIAQAGGDLIVSSIVGRPAVLIRSLVVAVRHATCQRKGAVHIFDPDSGGTRAAAQHVTFFGESHAAD